MCDQSSKNKLLKQQNTKSTRRSSDHKTDFFFVQRLKKDRWSTTTLFLVTKFFNERGKFWNGKTKQMQINGGIIIPVSDFKVTVDKSIAYSEARTKLFAKKAQRSRGKVQCNTESRLVSEKFPAAS